MGSHERAPRTMLDLTYLRENYVAAGLGDVLRDALQMFQEQLRHTLQSIQAAHASGNHLDLEQTIHTLKGTAGSVGAQRLANSAERLEQALHSQQAETIELLVEEVTLLTHATQAAIAAVLAQPHNRHWPQPL